MSDAPTRVPPARSALALVVLTTLLSLAGACGGTGEAQVTVPTYSGEIASIVYANCTTCHRPGGMGPMSLLTYEDVKARAPKIREKVSTQAMPPWHADAPRGRFLNDRRLSDADRSALLRWIDSGTPHGNAADTPPAPAYAEGWTIGQPDTVFTMATEFDVPAHGTIEYQYFEIPTNFTEDRWVQAIEILPGARHVVHHALVFATDPHRAARPAVLRHRRELGAPPESFGRGALVATTAPGTNAMTFQHGTALRIGRGAVLTLQMHYTAHGMAMKDRSSVGMIFAKQRPAQEVETSRFINTRFVIPPGAGNHQVDSEVAFDAPVRLWGLFPHTHVRGKRWEYHLTKPDGTSEVILSVPRYDFNWQTYYQFAEPLAVPAGSTLRGAAWYDNSAANPANPDPAAEVRWGEQTWEEMQYTGVAYTVDGR